MALRLYAEACPRASRGIIFRRARIRNCHKVTIDDCHMSVAESGTWKVIKTRTDFLALKSEWDGIFASNPQHRPFQAWGWVTAWLEHLAGPHSFHIICWRNEIGQLQFILPLISTTGNGRYRSPRLVSFCAYGPECSDHASCLRDPALDSSLVAMAAEAIGRFCGDSDRIELGNLEGTDDFPSNLGKVLRRGGRTARLTDTAVCPTVSLPDSWETFLQNFSSNFRSQIRRHHKRIERHDSLGFRTVGPSGAKSFAEDLIRLNRNRMDAKGKLSSLNDPAFRDFLIEAIPSMADAGLAWMDVVEEDSQTIGAALNLLYGNCVYFYMGGFDDDKKNLRPGTALFARVIMRSIGQGFANYDFLRGAESYKYRWGGLDAVNYRLDVYPKTVIGGSVSFLFESILDSARSLARRVRSIRRKDR